MHAFYTLTACLVVSMQGNNSRRLLALDYDPEARMWLHDSRYTIKISWYSWLQGAKSTLQQK